MAFLTGAQSGACKGEWIGCSIVGTFIGGLVGGIVGGVAGAEFGDDLGTKDRDGQWTHVGGSQQLLDEIALKSGYVQDAEELPQTLWNTHCGTTRNASDTSPRIECNRIRAHQHHQNNTDC